MTEPDEVRDFTTRVPDVQRLLPQSPDAERGVLSSFLLMPREVGGMCVEKKIRTEHFLNPSNADIYKMMLAMWADDKPIGMSTVTIELDTIGRLKECGGGAYIAELYTFLPTGANAAYYIEILIEKLVLRKAISISTKLTALCYDSQDETPTFLPKAIDDLENLMLGPESQIESLTESTIESIEERLRERALGAVIEGFQTGIHSIDAAMGGLMPSRYYAIAAAEKLGKTALLESIALHMNRHGHRVIFFQRDMSVKMMVERMACREAGIVFEDYDQNKLNDYDLGLFRKGLRGINKDLLKIHAPHGMTAKDMIDVFRRQQRKGEVALCILDVFGKLRTPSGEKTTGLTEASDSIRQAANDFPSAWMILAHISTEAKKNKRAPELWDLTWMKGLGGDVDWIATLSSEEDPTDREQPFYGKRQQMELSVKATRIGGPGKLEPLYFDRPLMRFYKNREGDL